MGVGGDGGSKDGGGMDLIEAVLTCEGNITDPELPNKLLCLVHHLRTITQCDYDWILKRVEPWNSVKVTFSIPREAAIRLHQLAQAGDVALRQLGILSVQVEGDQIVSLKVAGPNNETTEIHIRTDGAGPSGESMGHSNIVRSVTQAVCGTNIAPPYGQQPPQPHPVPQFRSPGLTATDGIPVTTTRPAVLQQRSQGQNFAYPLHSRQMQHALYQASTTLLVSGVSQTRPTPVVARQVFHNNPPPPYPSQEIARQPSNSLQQISGVSQINGQFNVNQSSVSNTLPHPVVHSQQTSIAQPVTGNFRVSGSTVTVSSSVVVQPSRGVCRTQVNMVKNSPLLVGLLQQPEQSSAVVTARPSKGVPVPTSHIPNPPAPLAVVNAENGPLPSAMPAAISSSGTFVGRSRDGLTTHQIFSGGSVITNAAPNPRHAAPVSMQHHPQAVMHSNLSNSRLQPHGVESRRVLVASSQSLSTTSQLSSMQSSAISSPASVITSASNHRVLNNEEVVSQIAGSHPSTSNNKKESQYLINPNTGLLEPRPSTDSSDSETDDKTSPLHDDQNSISLPSDDESNLSGASRKETDQSDSDVSRMSVNSIESRKINQDRVKSREADSSPGSSWEKSVVSSSPGEKIKVRLKLGKEQVAQTTIVGNAKKPDRKDSFMATGGGPLQNIPEPRVPKLHIKLHPSQPVIVKSIEESDSLSRKLAEKDGGKEDKGKRKSARSKPKSETDFDLVRVKNSKQKTYKERSNSDDISSQVLKIIEKKEDNTRASKLRDNADGRLKFARLLEENKLSLTKSSGKNELKSRTRLKNTSIRKVGDLSSVGEIASHKILETLPPSITKIAAMHTQQPHRNPSPIPSTLSSGSSLFSSPTIATALTSSVSTISPTTTPTISCSTPGELKSELEKRKSEVLKKMDTEQCTNDSLMTKIRLNSPTFQGIINGDLSHSEKIGLGCRARGKGSNPMEVPTGNKLTIKLKGSEEIHSLDSLKKELPEGLGTVPTFLNSSVQINKVSSDKAPSTTSLLTTHTEELPDKFKKFEGVKMPLMGELAGLKSNSDITIHSVSKNELLSLSKAGESERRLDMTIKHKTEFTKVGRVTCVDVTDRQALEEALKSSRNSSKKSDVNLANNNTTMMVDRLRRWNSIDSSNSVPFSSHSQQPISESTNLYSMAVKTESKEIGCSESEKSNTLSSVVESVKTESCIPQQFALLNNVDNKNDCDNRNKTNLNLNEQETDSKAKTIEDDVRERSPEAIVKGGSVSTLPESCSKPLTDAAPLQGEANAILSEAAQKTGEAPPKVQDVSNSSLIKPDVDSPEGTPKGEHGNGQGGEDSGIESMDALSEKSPNHSDQSPNRREDKEAEVFQEKYKKDPKDVQEKQENHPTPLPKNDVEDNSKHEAKLEKSYVDCGTKSHSELKPPLENYEPIADSSSIDVTLEKITSSISLDATKDDAIYALSLDDKLGGTSDVKDSFHDDSEAPLKVSDADAPSNEPDSHGVRGVVDKQDTSIEGVQTSQSCHSQGDSASDLPLQIPVTDSSVESGTLDADSKVTAGSQMENLDSENLNSKTPKSQCIASASESIVTSCSSSIALMTTSVSTSSPKMTAVVTTQSILLHNYVSTSASHHSRSCNFDSTMVNCTATPKTAVLPINTKPSLLAITLSRPPGSGMMTSQYAASLANNIDKVITPTLSTSSELTLPVTQTEKKVHDNVDSLANSICPNVSSKNNSVYSNSYTVTANTTATSMIILAASNPPAISTNACLSTSSNNISSSSSTSSSSSNNNNNSNKVTLKQNPVQTTPTPINPPVGKTFRLVALPGINSVTPASSSVKGQLVTLKPVVGANSTLAKNASVQSLPSRSPDVNNSKLQANLEALSPLPSNVPSHHDTDDLDFVGFSATDATLVPNNDELEQKPLVCEAATSNICPEKQASEEEPTPLRVNPPLYTYGNRERKKEIESETDEKDKEETKEQTTTVKEILQEEKEETMAKVREEIVENSIMKPKEKNLDALTIEIPAVDNFPDDKRLTRSTRQSARLASPKVNSPGSELSPKLEKKSPAGALTICKPSPVGVVRSSLSPALRVVKRRRHESESSTASSACEDSQDPPSKIPRRKASDKGSLVTKEDSKARILKGKEADTDKVLESSDEDSIHADDLLKKTSLSATEDDDESRPSSRLGRTLIKTTIRTRDRPSSAESSSKDSPSTLRRTSRQLKSLIPSEAPEKEALGSGSLVKDDPKEDEEEDASKELEKKDKNLEVKKAALCNKDGVKVLPKDACKDKGPPAVSAKSKTETDSDSSAASRRKTRSTTNTANEDPAKRRRLSKEK